MNDKGFALVILSDDRNFELVFLLLIRDIISSLQTLLLQNMPLKIHIKRVVNYLLINYKPFEFPLY